MEPVSTCRASEPPGREERTSRPNGQGRECWDHCQEQVMKISPTFKKRESGDIPEHWCKRKNLPYRLQTLSHKH